MSDVVEGLIRSAQRRVNGVVNIGTGVGHTLLELSEAVKRAVGVDSDLVVESAGSDEVEATLADVGRCQELLGFVPSTDIDLLLQRQYAYAARFEGLVMT